MKHRRLIIDGQILQTKAWHRGMGKYTLQAMHALSVNAPEDLELVVIFNTSLPNEAERFEAIQYLCPRIKQLHYDLPLAMGKSAGASDYRLKLESCIERDFSDTQNSYLLTALFYFDFFAEFPGNCRGLLLFYDLTPLLLWSDLGGYFPPDIYMERFQQVLQADHIFAISETTRRDVVEVFGLPPAKVTSINGGFTKIAESTKKPASFTVPKDYILFPSGDMPHKNNGIAVKGFELYFQQATDGLPMLITSHFNDPAKERLRSWSKNVIFTENVSDEELEWLYENARVVLFASKYEGLGLPILDAVASNKPIVATRIPVFEEMSEKAFYYFDQADADGLAKALTDAAKHTAFPEKAKEYAAILDKYTWENTSQAILDQVNSPRLLKPKSPTVRARHNESRIAIACLHPGVRGQIGRSAEQLYYSLKEAGYGVDFYFDPDDYHYKQMERPTFLDFFDCRTFDIAKLTLSTYRQYDQLVYLLDDAALPSRLAQRASILPGVALIGFGHTKLNNQQRMLKELMLENQLTLHNFKEHSYAECQNLINLLKADRENYQKQPSRPATIIRGGSNNKGIMKKLMALYDEQ